MGLLREVKQACFPFVDRVALATEAKTSGAFIRKRRVQVGLTQERQAKASGVPVDSVHELAPCFMFRKADNPRQAYEGSARIRSRQTSLINPSITRVVTGSSRPPRHHAVHCRS